MAQSRKNKDRKEKQEDYKTKHKMAKKDKTVQDKPFRQVPTWNAEDKFEITGAELDAFYNYFNIVAPAFTSIQQVFARGVKEEKIKIGYEYEDGTPVTEKELAAYTAKLTEYFKERTVQEQASQEQENAGKILDSYGSPVESKFDENSEVLQAEPAPVKEAS